MTSDRITEVDLADRGRQKQKVFSVPQHLRTAHGLDGATVLDILEGQIFRVNLVGSRIIELLKQGYCETEIAGRLAGEFAIEQRIVASDLREFLLTLEQYRLLFRRDGSPLP